MEGRVTEKEEETHLLHTGSLPKRPQRLGQAEGSRFFRVSQMGAKAQTFELSSIVLPGTFVGNKIGRVTARTQATPHGIPAS